MKPDELPENSERPIEWITLPDHTIPRLDSSLKPSTSSAEESPNTDADAVIRLIKAVCKDEDKFDHLADYARKIQIERDALRENIRIAVGEIEVWKAKRDSWRKCAQELAAALKFWNGDDKHVIGGHDESTLALREFNILWEASK